MQGIYGIDTDVYNVVGVASDQHTITNTLNVNANLTLDLSEGTWGPSSARNGLESTMTDSTAYNGEGMLSQSVPGQPWFYTTNAHEHGTTKTVITQIQGWTASGGSWGDPTTNYYDNDATSENYFDFTANNTYPNYTAPPNKAGVYTMKVSSGRV